VAVEVYIPPRKSIIRGPGYRKGQLCKLTPEVEDKIVEVLAHGNFRTVAARAAGITPPTFYAWVSRGEKEIARRERGEEPSPLEDRFVTLVERVAEVEANAEAAAVGVWQSQFPDDWRAARDWLERRHGDRWAPKDRHEVTTSGNGPSEILVAILKRSAAPSSSAEGERALSDGGSSNTDDCGEFARLGESVSLPAREPSDEAEADGVVVNNGCDDV